MDEVTHPLPRPLLVLAAENPIESEATFPLTETQLDRFLLPHRSIRFYFFARLRRGAERGAARRPAQPPREYSAELMSREESIKDQLREMALAFEEARYTADDIGPEKARRVRKVWDTIRLKMRLFKGEAEPGGNRTP